MTFDNYYRTNSKDEAALSSLSSSHSTQLPSLKLWSPGHPQHLHKLAREIESKGLWRGFLTPHEHLVFKHFVTQGDLDVWARFMDGDAVVQMQKPSQEEMSLVNQTTLTTKNTINEADGLVGKIRASSVAPDSKPVPITPTTITATTAVIANNPVLSRVKLSGNETTEAAGTIIRAGSAPPLSTVSSSLDLSNIGSGEADLNTTNTITTIPTQTTPSTPELITMNTQKLVSRIRYMLYERSISVLFPSSRPSEMPEFDFELLDIDDSDDEDKNIEKENNDTAVEKKPPAKPVRAADDDDYDDDEESDEDKPEEKMEDDVLLEEEKEGGDLVVANNKSPNDPIVIAGQPSISEEEQKQIDTAILMQIASKYHLFEGDREGLLKRRKLEESDRQINNEEDEDEDSHPQDVTAQNNPNNNNVTNASRGKPIKAPSFGAANLSLKHLLAAIDTQREKLSLSDKDLRRLISDVRKNRSKWANDDRIGQEELYEAAEKVVLELRGYTEHSTAFLNRVNKRDAPDYYNVIKKPMDLNTVMKKLKTFQYNSKKEFVDDVLLIWSNCLSYNTDPKHFLRAHALAMKKKTDTLVPLIPDITIRNRLEVEAEEARAEADIDGEGDADLNDTGDRIKGAESENESRVGMGIRGAARKGAGKSTKARKRQLDQESEDEKAKETGLTELETPVVNGGEDSTTIAEDIKAVSQDVKAVVPQGPSDAVNTDVTMDDITKEDISDEVDPDQARPAKHENSDFELDAAAADNDEDEDNDDNDDIEQQMWYSYSNHKSTAYCNRRNLLFQDDNLQVDAEAYLRTAKLQRKFSDKESAVARIPSNGVPGNLIAKYFKYHDQNDNDAGDDAGDNMTLLESINSNNNKDFLVEYEIMSGIPDIPWSLSAENDFDGIDEEAMLKAMDDLKRSSDYISLKGGINDQYLENLAEIQHIRKVCSKIALIRQMQQSAYMHSNQFKPYEIVAIDEPDLDIESRLPNRDRYNEEVSRAALKRSVAKIAMHSGFEKTEVVATDVLTDLAADYITKLGKTLVLYMQNSNSGPEDMSYEDVILNTLEDNGLEGINDLDSYLREDVERHGSKLKELKNNLVSFLTDLLRPTLANGNGSGGNEFRSNQFNDGSEQFISGDFSEEIGEDFFGFRELGLDKEFGLLSSSVPLHLLHSRLNNNAMFEQSSIQITELTEVPDYKPLDRKAANNVIGLLRPFFIARLDASKNVEVLLEGEQLPPKQRNIRPKVPPTGKINGVRKKQLNRVFFRKHPEPEPVEPVKPVGQSTEPTQDDNTEIADKDEAEVTDNNNNNNDDDDKLDQLNGLRFSLEPEVALPTEPVAVGSLMGTVTNDDDNNGDGYDNEDFGDLF